MFTFGIANQFYKQCNAHIICNWYSTSISSIVLSLCYIYRKYLLRRLSFHYTSAYSYYKSLFVAFSSVWFTAKFRSLLISAFTYISLLFEFFHTRKITILAVNIRRHFFIYKILFVDNSFFC